MIASLGGATIDSSGNRTYKGSGGMVGGLSFEGGNWAYFSGAGKKYNRFTPDYNPALRLNEPIEIEPETGGGGGGGGTNGGGGGTVGGGGTTVNTYPSANSAYSYFNLPSSPYRHLSGINSGGQSLIAALNAIFAAYRSGEITLAQALQQANQLSGYLNNSSVFYQAQHGQDAAALSNFRTQAQSIIAAIGNFIFPSNNTANNAPCVGCDVRDTPSGSGTNISDLLASLFGNVPSATSVEAPPNLFQFTPENQSNGVNNNMRNIVILVAALALGYWLYKKYA